MKQKLLPLVVYVLLMEAVVLLLVIAFSNHLPLAPVSEPISEAVSATVIAPSP